MPVLGALGRVAGAVLGRVARQPAKAVARRAGTVVAAGAAGAALRGGGGAPRRRRSRQRITQRELSELMMLRTVLGPRSEAVKLAAITMLDRG